MLGAKLVYEREKGMNNIRVGATRNREIVGVGGTRLSAMRFLAETALLLVAITRRVDDRRTVTRCDTAVLFY